MSSILPVRPVILIAILAAAAVASFMYTRESPEQVGIVNSENIVRDFVSTASQEVRTFQRSLRLMLDKVEKQPESIAATVSSLEDLAQDTLSKLDAGASGAISRIEAVDGINWRTHQNRVGRIEERAGEMKEFVAALAEDIRAELQEVRAELEDNGAGH